MESKICTQYSIEKHIKSFCKKNQNEKTVTSNEVENVTLIIKIKYQFNKKIYYGKNRDKQLQKQNDYRNKRNTDYKELLRSYAELENKLKALKEKVKKD